MCLSCSRKENRRLYLFMQLSVMMMFSGQSTWEMTRRRGDREWGVGCQGENRGVSASECERKWNRMGEAGDGRRQEGGQGESGESEVRAQ